MGKASQNDARTGGTAPAAPRLRIIATTDLHAHLLPHDYYADRPSATGLALAAPLIRRLRAEAEAEGAAVLVADNGDLIQGSLMSDWLRDRDAEEGGLHPMVAALQDLGFDAAALGNHEFNFGLPFLGRAYAGAALRVVCANVSVGSATLRPPWAVIERPARGPDGQVHLVRIGVIGLAPPQIRVWDRRILGGAVATRGILEAAAAEAPRMRAAGADLVVALCHSGIDPAAEGPDAENAAVPLAASGLVDAIVAGHTHEVFPDPAHPGGPGIDARAGSVHGVPVVQPGSFGRHVGVLDLALEPGGAGRWRVAGHRARAIRVTPPGVPPEALAARADPAVAALAAPVHARLRAPAAREVGVTRQHLHSYLSLIGPDAVSRVLADAQRAHAARLLAGSPAAALPVLVSTAPYRSGGRGGPDNYVDVPPGPVALREAEGLYVFPNGVALVEIDGRALREWLERSASIYRTLIPGETDQPLLDPDFPSYNFSTIDGLSYAIDPTRPPRAEAAGRVLDPDARRVRDLRQAGRPVGDADRFVLATNSYRLAASGRSLAGRGVVRLMESARLVRDVVIAHVRAAPVDPAPREGWRLAAPPGTAAWFDTGPPVLAHLAASGRRIDDLGPAPEGFRRLRVWL